MTLDELLNGQMKGQTLFHFTDARNVDSIQSSGGLLSLSEITKRGVTVPAAGGNVLSHELDKSSGLDLYVHLCFRSNHPMEYRARQDGRIESTRWLKISPDVLKLEGVRITLDVANKSGVGMLRVEDALDKLDLEILYRWLPTFRTDQRTRLGIVERYEVLVPRIVALEHIVGF